MSWSHACGLPNEFLRECKRDGAQRNSQRIIQLIGERHSGTNLAETLLKLNFGIDNVFPYMFKHALHMNPKDESSYENAFAKMEKNNATVLYLVRSPFSWVSRMYDLPHIKTFTFSASDVPLDTTVTRQWPSIEFFLVDNTIPDFSDDPKVNGSFHSNIMKMRTYKLKFFEDKLRRANVDSNPDIDPITQFSSLAVTSESTFIDGGVQMVCDIANKLKLCPLSPHVLLELVHVSPGSRGIPFAVPTYEEIEEELQSWERKGDLAAFVEKELDWSIERDLYGFLQLSDMRKKLDSAKVFGI